MRQHFGILSVATTVSSTYGATKPKSSQERWKERNEDRRREEEEEEEAAGKGNGGWFGTAS